MAGTNDAWFRDKRPQAFAEARLCKDSLANWHPSETVTLADAVTYVCSFLRSSFPGARLVLTGPMPSTAVAPELIARTADIIEATGQEMSLPVIRLDRNTCFNSYDEQREHHFTYDGTHTSEAGAKCIGRLIAEYIVHSGWCIVRKP